jgi:hypothetical protein
MTRALSTDNMDNECREPYINVCTVAEAYGKASKEWLASPSNTSYTTLSRPTISRQRTRPPLFLDVTNRLIGYPIKAVCELFRSVFT